MSTRRSLLALALLAPVFPLTAPAADTVPGIAEPTDMNLWFIAKPKVSPSPDAEK